MLIGSVEQSWPLLAALGCVSGFLSGLLGIGGGAVIVPGLVVMLPMLGVEGEVLPKIAIATSVAIMIPTSIASAQQHCAQGSVDWYSLTLFTPSIVLGSFAAGFFAHAINTQLLCLLFVLYMLHIARGMVRRRTVRAQRHASARTRPHLVAFTFVGLIGGALSSLLGQGNSTYSVPFMSRFIAMRQAIGTAALLNIPLAAAGVLGYISGESPRGCGTACFGYVHLPAVAAIGISSVLAAPAGALLTQGLPVMVLRRLFAVVLAGSALNLAAKTLPLAAAPTYVADALQRLRSPRTEHGPVAAVPPACLADPTVRTSYLVAEYGPRQYFTVWSGGCPSPATISAVLSMLRGRAEPAAGFWLQPAAMEKFVPARAATIPPTPARRPRTPPRKPVKEKLARSGKRASAPTPPPQAIGVDR